MIEVCYSQNEVNRSTAKGSLTQAINSIFNAMARQEQMDQNIELDLDELVVKSVLDSIINQVVASENATNHQKDSNAGMGQNSILSVSSLSVENLADHLPNTM
uniref:Uncharacterized protein n=1 Tax=Panagrolaimus sp. JU765 TaxID=591449 RepID=A0AC34Q8G6_9BILA